MSRVYRLYVAEADGGARGIMDFTMSDMAFNVWLSVQPFLDSRYQTGVEIIEEECETVTTNTVIERYMCTRETLDY